MVDVRWEVERRDVPLHSNTCEKFLQQRKWYVLGPSVGVVSTGIHSNDYVDTAGFYE